MTPTDLIAGTEKPRTTVDRRDFIRVCTLALAAVGMPYAAAAKVAKAIASKKLKPSVIWLHFQECTGCTESLLRTSHPAVAELILDLVSLDYCETLFAAAGHQAEAALKKAMTRERREVRPRDRRRDPDEGQRHLLPDRRAHRARDRPRGRGQGRRDHRDRLLRVVGRHSVRRPEPDRRDRRADGSQGQDRRDDPGLPGEPVQPARHGPPVRDVRHSARTRREEPARSSRTAARSTSTAPAAPTSTPAASSRSSATKDTASGYCLYKLGCKGPATHANCSIQHFGEVIGAWPIGIGHPCFGCTEQTLAFRVPPVHDGRHRSARRPPTRIRRFTRSRAASARSRREWPGVIGGALLGAGYMASRKLGEKPAGEEKDPGKEA